MRGVRVKINRAVWGREVMASARMKAFLAARGAAVAARLPGSVVSVSDAPAAGGGRRARARVRTSVTMRQEADTGRAQAALRAVIPTARRSR